MREVVITGQALQTPLGNQREQYVKGWRSGESVFQVVEDFNPEDSKIKFAGVCPKPDTKKLPDRKVQKILRRKDINALISCLECLSDSKIDRSDLNPERSGMFIGTGSIQINDLASFFPIIEKTVDAKGEQFDSLTFGRELLSEVNPLALLQTLMNNGLCYSTMALDFRGVNGNIVDFQTSGLRAIGEAFRAIQENRADVMIAGGISAPVEPMHYSDGVEMGYLANTKNFDQLPKDFIRPWDKNRSGAVMSEGVGFFLLEEKTMAECRGANILAKVTDFASGSDGHMNMMNGGKAHGLKSAIRQIGLRQRDFRDLGVIIGHANGSIGCDDQEAKIYNEIFAGKVPCYSPKGSFGDLCEASGALATAVAIDCLQEQTIYPMYNFSLGDEHSGQSNIPKKSMALDGSKVLITARNLVGASSALLIEAVQT